MRQREREKVDGRPTVNQNDSDLQKLILYWVTSVAAMAAAQE